MGHGIVKNYDLPAYAHQPAWHGLGTTLDRLLSSNDVLTETSVGAYDVLQSPGLIAYDPDTMTAWVPSENGPSTPPAHFKLRGTSAVFNVRSDVDITATEALLSPTGVGERYEVVQNRELVDIADAVFGEAGAKFESAGTLFAGKFVWLLARYTDDLDVAGDRVSKYILIYSSHDGSCKIVVKPTPIRVVCHNTLSWALDKSQGCFEFRHTANVRDRIALAIEAVASANAHFDAAGTIFNSMARKAIDDRFVTAYLEALYPDPRDVNGNVKNTTQVEKKRSLITQLLDGSQANAFGGGMRIDGQPTQWALMNAVSEYWQYASISRPSGGADKSESRMRSNMLGGTQEIQRQNAFDLLQRGSELVTTAVSVN